MSPSSSFPNVVLSRRVLILGTIVFLSAALTAGYIWVMRDQSIAPPGLRVMNWFWRVFVCHCAF